MKKVLIGIIVLVSSVIISNAALQETEAQNTYGIDCAKEYEKSKLGCLDSMKTCGAECDEAYPFDPTGAAARCKSICDSDRNSCDALVDDWYRECIGLETSDTDSPMPKTVFTAKPAKPSDQPVEQPLDRSIEQTPQTIVDWTNDVDNLFITLSGGFDPVFVTFLDKITENNPEVFLNKQPDEQQKILDDFIKSEKPATVVIGTVNGKPIEVELRDMPLADTAQAPLEAVARQDIKGILEISPSLWLNSEETLIRDAGPYPVPGGEQEKYLLSEEHRQKGHFSLPIVDPIGLSFEEYHQKRGKMLSLFESSFEHIVPIVKTANGLSVSVILIGVDIPVSKRPPITEGQQNPQISNWENIKFITKPGARQIGVLNDTPFVLHPDSQVGIQSLNTLELSNGAVEIQRPDDPLDSSFVVETPIGTVKSNKTHFWVAYNPIRGYTLVGVWEGAVSVTHAYIGKTMMLEAFENGTPNIALLLSPEFRKSKTSIWFWILLVATASVGYLVYRNKDAFMKIIKKQQVQ